MLTNFSTLLRYRALISALVARELKARYRGSLLGFFWSFVNPLLLLLIYNFVFTKVMPAARGEGLEPYALFLFCGLLPWTWFASSLLESANVLIAGGNLIRKVMFPAEVLPIVTVLAGLVHYGLGLLVLAAFFVYYGHPVVLSNVVWLPLVIAIQLALTLGLSLLIAALTVHFRDLRDLLQNLLTLWFFGTPIIYPLSAAPASARWLLNLNPFTHLAAAYQDVLFRQEPFTAWRRLLIVGAASLVVLVVGYVVFDRLRDTLAEEV